MHKRHTRRGERRNKQSPVHIFIILWASLEVKSRKRVAFLSLFRVSRLTKKGSTMWQYLSLKAQSSSYQWLSMKSRKSLEGTQTYSCTRSRATRHTPLRRLQTFFFFFLTNKTNFTEEPIRYIGPKGATWFLWSTTKLRRSNYSPLPLISHGFLEEEGIGGCRDSDNYRSLDQSEKKKKNKSPGWAKAHNICPINQLAIVDDWNKHRNPRRDVAFSI